METHICFYSPHAYQLFNPRQQSAFGGAEVQLWRLARALAAKPGWQVSFIVGDYGQPPSEVRDGVRLVRTVKIGHPDTSMAAHIIGVWRTVREVDADIYVARAASAEVGVISLFCRLFRRRFVYMTAHEMDCTGEFIRRHRLAGLSFAYGLLGASRVISQREDHRRLIKDRLRIEAQVVPSSIEVPPSRPSGRRDIPVLWVGRCETWKRPDLLLDLAQRMPAASFVMIAPRQEHVPELYIKTLERVANIPNVHFVPKVPLPEADRYFARAQVLVNTSTYEGFPNTFLQAGAAGTPIVSWAVNPGDLFADGGGVCARKNMDELVRSVQRLLIDSDLWQRSSQAVFEYVRANHDLPAALDRFTAEVSATAPPPWRSLAPRGLASMIWPR